MLQIAVGRFARQNLRTRDSKAVNVRLLREKIQVHGIGAAYLAFGYPFQQLRRPPLERTDLKSGVILHTAFVRQKTSNERRQRNQQTRKRTNEHIT